MQVTPAASSRSRAAGSPKRATPKTSLRSARARATGRPTCPVGPVIRTRLPSSWVTPSFYSLGSWASIRPSTSRHGKTAMSDFGVPPTGHAHLRPRPSGVEPPEVGRADDLGAVDDPFGAEVGPLVRAPGLHDAGLTVEGPPHDQVQVTVGRVDDLPRVDLPCHLHPLAHPPYLPPPGPKSRRLVTPDVTNRRNFPGGG